MSLKHYLRLQHISLQQAKHWVLKHISLAFGPQQLTVLLGPNGSGKTSLLKLCAGLWQPSQGQITLYDKNLGDYPRRQLAQQLTFVPQKIHFHFAFTVKETVMMGRHPHLNRFQNTHAHDEQCVAEALRHTDLMHLAHRPVTQLSGGEQQRVSIARSLATQAPIILLDEPTANLDIAHSLSLFNLLRELAQQGKTIIFSTHDLNQIINYADQAILLNQGTVYHADTPEKVLTEAAVQQVFKVNLEKRQFSQQATSLFFSKMQ